MGIYPHPWKPRLLVAYTWFGLRWPTPRWLDDVDHELFHNHPWIGRPVNNFFSWGRSAGVIGLRYWGRA